MISMTSDGSTVAGAVLLVLGGVLVTAGACTDSGGSSSTASSGAPSSSSSGGTGGTGGTSAMSSSSSGSSSSGGPPCANVLQGSFTIQNATDIATVTPYCEITGDLHIHSAGLTSISLPALTTIGGQLELAANGLSKLSLPALTTIGSRLLSSSGPMDELDLPALTSVNSIELGSVLTTLNVPKLTSVARGVGIRFAPSATISFPALVSVGQEAADQTGAFYLRGGASLSAPLLSDCKYLSVSELTTSVDLPALTSVEALGYCNTGNVCPVGIAPTITMNALTSISHIEFIAPGSPSVSFPNLVSIGYGVISASSFSAPKLVTFGDVMALSSLSSVSTIDLGALQTVHNLNVTETSLAELDLPALVSGNIVFGSVHCPMSGVISPCSVDPQLLQVKAPQWASGSAFFGDSTFPTCRASAICMQLGQNPASGSCWCSPLLPSPPCSQATAPCP
jgi:hypothetical protein